MKSLHEPPEDTPAARQGCLANAPTPATGAKLPGSFPPAGRRAGAA